ncbi:MULTISPECIES: helicase-related protein [unclassified Saccharibacter]|uniref:helicase-related protein n=1 Tax=unclassified Saccharibacter TaxID=2648722 RepID=UPI001329976A|nr:MULTISPECIES: helicase-related protein [unclassified Saccharibacter]MXV36096.1 RNA helicase [Saccharibacter sp. EH611]MXV56955.1 RNA helicase [Saccharibacter sp. EH70]MXV66685.1 RNA helicase [Saccharibacter sp. EH60]
MSDPSMPHSDRPLSPAERALEHAEQAFGEHLKITPRERTALIRQAGRRLSAEKNSLTELELLHALCQVRRRGWANGLMNVTHRAGDVWVRKMDVLTVSERVSDPMISQEALREMLDVVLEERWREMADSPHAVMEEVRADLADAGTFLSSGQIERLSHSIARAFGGVDMGFEDDLIVAEERRAREQEEIRQRAEERRAREMERLKQWEAHLVDFNAVPAILRCSRREALRWIAENRLPVAKRETNAEGLETFFFDPSELKKCRPLINAWRKGRSGHEELEDDNSLKSRRGNAAIARVAALDRFAAHFRTARSLKRRITLVTGPTNSGKSHTALQALAEAESGVALAPLRLLAHEFREAMLSNGVAASLTTGEERIIDPTARHLAATVEMCPFNNPVDVAIIDEAQMLSDPDRGAAWTAAIMGVPARHVFILGAADCIPLVKRIAELCNDPVDEIHLERKSPLKPGGSLALEELRAGDALIAFSRREVLDLRAELMSHNRRVAVIYGALSPEVRRAEAARFNRGDADILVATDAIGMGLNLSIRRVIFSTLRKYDGRQTRSLTTQEIKQIGGRAGRFGKHEEGLVCVLDGAGSPNFIRQMLNAPPEPIKELRPLVQPDSDIVQAVAQEVGTQSLYGVLTRIKRAVLRPDDPNYRLADMEQALEIAAALEGVEELDLPTRWTYAMCPINTRDNGISRLVEWASIHAKGRAIYPPGTGRLPASATASREELERAEKRHRRLVAWRWLAMRFPKAYPDLELAERNATILDEWIEQVLRTQSRMRENTRRQQGRNSAPWGKKKRHSPAPGKKKPFKKGKRS